MPRHEVWVLPVFAAAAYAVATCYKPDGSVSKFFPCNLDAAISPCCNDVDFCMSNGLCLNGGSDNAFTLQGCTDPSWRAPCAKICDGPMHPDGFIHIWLCGVNQYCCGSSDFSCCSNSTAEIHAISPASTLSRPGGIPSGIPGASTSITPSSTGSRSNLTASTTLGDPRLDPTRLQPAGGGVDTSVVTVGLGVGIPLGLALLVALAILGWQIRKLKELQRVSHGTEAYRQEGQQAPQQTGPPVELPGKQYGTHEVEPLDYSSDSRPGQL